MELLASHNHPRGYGGGPASFVTDYLGADPVNFGCALDVIEVSICNEGENAPKPWTGFEMPDRPTCRFLRKRKKLAVTWPGTRHSADEVDQLYLTNLTRSTFRRGAEELHDAMSWAFAQRLKPSDAFDVAACLDWVASTLQVSFDSDQKLQAVVEKHGRKKRTRLRKAELDRSMTIDWTRYHPGAAYHLPDPWYWDESDERAPHGNAVGAAIISQWERFGLLDAEDAYRSTGLPEWAPEAGLSERKNAVRAHIALVIAHLKFSAFCPTDIASAAITCLKAEKAMPDSPWARRYKGLPVSALDHYLYILEPWV